MSYLIRSLPFFHSSIEYCQIQKIHLIVKKKKNSWGLHEEDAVKTKEAMDKQIYSYMYNNNTWNGIIYHNKIKKT